MTIENQQLEVRKILAPSKKLVQSNVYTCIPNSVLLETLHQHNIKTTSAIFDLHIGTSTDKYDQSELQKYSHISSFWRSVYISKDADIPIPDSLLINFDNEMHRIFIHDGDLCCHLCFAVGHNASMCPEMEQDTTQTQHPEEPEPDMNALPSTTVRTTVPKRPLSQSDTLSQSQLKEFMENENAVDHVSTSHRSSSI